FLAVVAVATCLKIRLPLSAAARTSTVWPPSAVPLYVPSQPSTVAARPCRTVIVARRRRTLRGWHLVGFFARLCRPWQRMRRTTFENAIAVTVGIPIFIANACGAEMPWAPPPSTALFSAVHRTAWSPTPPTGTWATLPLYQCDRAPSVEHEIPSTPDGP